MCARTEPAKRSSPAAAVSDPNSVIHTHHVEYDQKTRSYKGLPPEWSAALNRQFGVDPIKLESSKLPEYASRIPIILQQMKEYLVAHGGLAVEGIFRIAPDADESTFVKQQLNENKFETCKDVNIMSNLLKVFFRDLPDKKLLDTVRQEQINDCDSVSVVACCVAAAAAISCPHHTVAVTHLFAARAALLDCVHRRTKLLRS